MGRRVSMEFCDLGLGIVNNFQILLCNDYLVKCEDYYSEGESMQFWKYLDIFRIDHETINIL